MKSALATAKFWWETADRAIKTSAQDIIKFLTAGQVMELTGVDWRAALAFAGFGGLLSILTSIVSAPFGSENSPTILGNK